MKETISARVIKSTGSWYHVMDKDLNITECRLRGKFRVKGLKTTNPVAVGDIIDFDPQTNSIINIQKRKNYIIRKATNLSKQSHIIASNMDQAIIIVSLALPRTSTGFIDRFLITAEAYHIPAVIVFNKIDLLDEKSNASLQDIINTYTNIGYQCLQTSVKESINLDKFASLLDNKISLLAGHSGVGKSALINTVDPNFSLREGEISDYHSKGMHTTTFAEMFRLESGAYIIDTPGIKEFGLIGFEQEELGQRFPEFRLHMDDCKYNNCLHINEPGCAINKAVKDGQISKKRYHNYINILSSI